MEGTNKMPRYMKEYAQNKMIKINAEALSGKYQDYPHAARIAAIEGAKIAYQRGLITIDEAMKLIAEA